jgi:hypothetical protein
MSRKRAKETARFYLPYGNQITMAFCGHTDIQTVDKSILLPGTFPTA